MAAESAIAHYPYYHGTLSREEACTYLENSKKGSFVIRDSSRGPGCLVISLVQTPKILHLLVKRDKKNHFMLDPDAWKDHSLGTETFSALQLLIARLQQYGMLSDGLSKSDLKAISSEIDAKRKGEGSSGEREGSPKERPVLHDSSSSNSGAHHSKQASGEHKNTGSGSDSRSSSPAPGSSGASIAAHLRVSDKGGNEKFSPPPSPVHRALSLLQRADKLQPSSHIGGGGEADDEEELKKAMLALEMEAEYKGMLNAMIIDKLTTAKIANLEDFRKKHGISADQHTKVLKSLGLTASQFADMKRIAEQHDANSSGTEENETECIICMTRRRQIAFVSCGHVATCVDCSKGLTVCPVCRKPITSIMRIFT